MKISTICFLVKGNQIFLAMKKVRFGKGYLNGYGGRKKSRESISDCFHRELEEESSVKIKSGKVVATINFFKGQKHLFKCYISLVFDWEGKFRASDEMDLPRPYFIQCLPYHLMWHGDKVWLPLLLDGKKFVADLVYDKKMKKVKFFSVDFNKTPRVRL